MPEFLKFPEVKKPVTASPETPVEPVVTSPVDTPPVVADAVPPVEPVVTPPVETPPVETKATDTPPVETPPVEAKPDIVEFITPYGNTKVGDEPKPIETPDAFFEIMTKQAGKPVKTYEEAMAILNDPNKVSIEKVQEAEQKVMEYDTFFRNLPTEISALIQDSYNGKDIKETMKKFVGAIDYSKPVTAYTDNDLILLTNKDYTEAELEDLEPKVIKSLANAAKATYANEHNAIITKEKELKTKEFDGAAKYLKSIDKSIERLKKEMPNLEPEKIQKIKQQMKEGYSFWKDGQYTEEAAYKIANAEYGKDIVQSVIDQQIKINQKHTNQAVSKANEQHVATANNDSLKKASAVVPQGDPVDKIKNESFPYFGKK